jgi:hypothetical protein
MRSRRLVSCPGLIGLLIILLGPSRADAQERYHAWIVGAHGGPSFFTQDPVSDANITGALGPIFEGVIVYDLHPYVSLGFEGEWEKHKIDQAALTLGDASMTSLLIRVEGHLERARPISPYFLFASGYNLNSFSEEDAYLATCGEDCRINIDNGFAIKAGFGVDMFLLFENAAINVEIAWKYNKADVHFLSGGNVVSSDDFNGSSLSLALGFRYHFPVTPF